MKKKDKSFRSCLICQTPSPVLISKATTSIKNLPLKIQVSDKYFGYHGDIVKCKLCNFVYVGEEAYVQKVLDSYEEMRDEVYVTEEKERRKSFLSIVQTLERLNSGRKGKIIDIGCCTGGLLAEASKRGWKVLGIDPSIWACKLGQNMHKIKIYNGTIEKYRQKNQLHDAITMIDFLEHVQKPVFVLKKVRKMLNDDGLVCIVTPNYNSLLSKVLRNKWWGIRLAHISYFTLKDLNRIFELTDFEIVKRKEYVRYFSLYYILVRIIPRIEDLKVVKHFFKRITIPLNLFDTFEIYLKKKSI